MTVACGGCRADVPFDQPYPYHAGFGDQGFLYNEAGTLTLVWSSLDPAYSALGGGVQPWSASAAAQAAIEAALVPSPAGDRWLFANLARCPSCGCPLRQSIRSDIYYLIYPGSVLTEADPRGFAAVLRAAR